MKFSMKYVALSLLASMFIASGAYAATQSVTANIAFDAAITLTLVDDIDFGIVETGAGNYTITPAGVVTANTGALINQTGAHGGEVTIAGSTTQTVRINTGTYVADQGITPSAATCAYDGGAATACDAGLTGQTAPGEGKTLRLGVTVAGTPLGASAAPTFVVTVIYG